MEKKELFKKVYKQYDTQFYRDHVDINTDDYGMRNHPKFKKGIFELTSEKSYDEKSFLDNYQNLLCSVQQINRTVVLEECGDKLSLKLFRSEYKRNVGIKFFSKNKDCHFITVNKKTGDFYVGNLLRYQNKIKFSKVIRKNPNNYIGMISEHFSIITLPVRQDKHITNLSFLINEFVIGLGITDNILHSFQVESKVLFNFNLLAKSLIKYSLLKKNIKLPNNLNSFFDSQYSVHIPKTKLLRKHKLKFVDAFMEHHGLSGNEIKKNLHLCDDTNVNGLKSAINYFGYDKLYKSNIILDLLNQKELKSFHNFPENFTKSEKDKLFTYFLWQLKGDINSNTLYDHIIYYNQLKTYGEKISLNAKNIDDFVTEHANWSVIISSYKTGYHVRSYNNEFVEEVQKSIFDYNGVEYTPVLLLTTDDYIGESAYQNNCVRTYVDKCSSVIISLRNGYERATIEYMVTYYPHINQLKMNRVQSLGKFNKQLSEIWNPVLEMLDVQVGMSMKSHEFTASMKTSYKNGKTFNRKMITKLPNPVHKDFQYIGLVQWDLRVENQDNFNLGFDF
jgi:hypothetical protein